MNTIPQHEPIDKPDNGTDYAYLEHLAALEEQKQKREFLTTQQIANELGVHQQRVAEWIRNGKGGLKLKAVKLARRYEVSRYDLNRFLEKQP